jgi:hypothetical protein
MSRRSDVDISADVACAHKIADEVASMDGPMGELWANYRQWGDLLEAWNCGEYAGTDAEFEAECRDHLDLSVLLGRAVDEYSTTGFAARTAQFAARYHNGKGE